MPKHSACVLASGGLDSLALLALALRRHRRVHPVYVRFGLLWEAAELHALGKILRSLRRPSLAPLEVLDQPAADVYGRHWSLTGQGVPGYRSADRSVYLPGRNLLLLSKAGVFCALRKIPNLYLGVLAGNPFPDARPGFLAAVSRALALGLKTPLRILTPFRSQSKRSVLKRFPDLPYRLAFSCLRPKGLSPCGRCNKCAERDQALRSLA